MIVNLLLLFSIWREALIAPSELLAPTTLVHLSVPRPDFWELKSPEGNFSKLRL